MDEVAQELPRFREPAELVELQASQIPTQQDPVVYLLQRDPVRINFLQQRFAKRVERRQHHVFAALANSLYHPRFHFPGGFFGEGEAQNIFAQQRLIRLQQVPDALRNDAGFSRTGACNHQQRPLAVRDRAVLSRIQLQPSFLLRFSQVE